MMDEQKRQEELQALKRDIFESLHCALPGTVVSFDSETQMAVIQPTIKTSSDVEFPLLRDVPVFMPVSFEIQEGDSFDIDNTAFEFCFPRSAPAAP